MAYIYIYIEREKDIVNYILGISTNAVIYILLYYTSYTAKWRIPAVE